MGSVNPQMESHPYLDDEAAIRQRVSAAIARAGGVSSVADKTGIPPGTLSKYAARTSTASFTNAAKIARATQVALDDLAFGTPPKMERLARMLERMGAASDAPSVPAADLVQVPRFDIQASAGPGMVPAFEAADIVVAFDRQFLRNRGAVPERCSVIETRGDSMQPTIPDGSLLIVDHSQTDVGNGAIYVIGVSDTVLVKRVRLRVDGAVELASDNAAYAPEIINRDQLADLRVIGKVVYYCRVP